MCQRIILTRVLSPFIYVMGGCEKQSNSVGHTLLHTETIVILSVLETYLNVHFFPRIFIILSFLFFLDDVLFPMQRSNVYKVS